MSPTAQTGVVDVADLDRQNGATLGRILGRGSVGEAEEGPDGKMRATVRIPEDELVFEPGIVVLPHAGELELTLINDDKNTHCAVLPSNGDYQFIWLVNHSKGIGEPHARRPGLLLVRLPYRQRRGPRPDRRHRRPGRRAGRRPRSTVRRSRSRSPTAQRNLSNACQKEQLNGN